MKEDMWHVWGRREMYMGFGWGNLKERENLYNVGTDKWAILKLFLMK
jgi:hypothetical protein